MTKKLAIHFGTPGCEDIPPTFPSPWAAGILTSPLNRLGSSKTQPGKSSSLKNGGTSLLPRLQAHEDGAFHFIARDANGDIIRLVAVGPNQYGAGVGVADGDVRPVLQICAPLHGLTGVVVGGIGPRVVEVELPVILRMLRQDLGVTLAGMAAEDELKEVRDAIAIRVARGAGIAQAGKARGPSFEIESLDKSDPVAF